MQDLAGRMDHMGFAAAKHQAQVADGKQGQQQQGACVRACARARGKWGACTPQAC